MTIIKYGWLVAQAVTGYRAMILAHGTAGGRGAKGLMEEILNSGRADEEAAFIALVRCAYYITVNMFSPVHCPFQDHVVVTNVDVGEVFPVLSNARVRPSDEAGKVVRPSCN